MPTIARLGKLLIQVYANDHNPPHFHAVTADEEALIRIDTLEILQGLISRRSYRAACEWASANRNVLEAEWRRLNEQ